eukprot:RCo006548
MLSRSPSYSFSTSQRNPPPLIKNFCTSAPLQPPSHKEHCNPSNLPLSPPITALLFLECFIIRVFSDRKFSPSCNSARLRHTSHPVVLASVCFAWRLWELPATPYCTSDFSQHKNGRRVPRVMQRVPPAS